uniref:Uncharacterized protein n=1 Tax=mine drainage metagenome TaxID=410659 RepID=E6Q1C1_9ZZZZ
MRVQNQRMNAFHASGLLVDPQPERKPRPIALYAWGGSPCNIAVEAAIVELAPQSLQHPGSFALLLRGEGAASLHPTPAQRARGDIAAYARHLARRGATHAVHLFARSLPDESVLRRARRAGVEIIVSPIEVLGAMTVVHGELPPPSAPAQDAA